MRVFRDYPWTNRTGENALLGSEAGAVLVFLWRVHAQSGFRQGLGECNAIRSLDVDTTFLGFVVYNGSKTPGSGLRSTTGLLPRQPHEG